MPRDPNQLAKRIVDLATMDEAERAEVRKKVAAKIRAISRVTGVSKNAIIKLLNDAGRALKAPKDRSAPDATGIGNVLILFTNRSFACPTNPVLSGSCP